MPIILPRSIFYEGIETYLFLENINVTHYCRLRIDIAILYDIDISWIKDLNYLRPIFSSLSGHP